MRPLNPIYGISDQDLERVLNCFVERRILDGLQVLQGIIRGVADLDPSSVAVQRLIGRFSFWIADGFADKGAFPLLLDKFTPELIKWLPATTQACVRLARAVQTLMSGDAASSAKKLQTLLTNENIDNPDVLMMIHFLLCRCWQRDCHYDLAMSDGLKALQMATEGGRIRMAAVISTTVAWLQIQAGKSDEPRRRLAEAAGILSETDDDTSLAKIESCLGRLDRRLGQHKSACAHFEKSLEYCLRCPEQSRYLARSRANLAFEQRLLALSYERELDQKAQFGKKQAYVEAEFMDIFSNCSTLLKSLLRHDATLALLWERNDVQHFAHAAISALADLKADREIPLFRADLLAKIQRLRDESRRNAIIAGNLYLALDNERGRSTAALTLGYLELDEFHLGQASAYALQAERLAAPGDGIAKARVKLLECMIAHQQAEEEEDDTLRHSVYQRALATISEGADLIRGTQHERLKGKISLWIAFSHVRVGNLDEARQFQADAELRLKSPPKDYVRHDLKALGALLADTREAETQLQRLMRRLTDRDPSATRKSLRQEFDKIMVQLVWQQERNVDRVAKRLKMAQWAVAKIVRDLGLN